MRRKSSTKKKQQKVHIPVSSRLSVKKSETDQFVFLLREIGTYTSQVLTTQANESFTLLKFQVQNLSRQINEMPYTLTEKKIARIAAQKIAVIPSLSNIEDVREKITAFYAIITPLSARIGLEEIIRPDLDVVMRMLQMMIVSTTEENPISKTSLNDQSLTLGDKVEVASSHVQKLRPTSQIHGQMTDFTEALATSIDDLNVLVSATRFSESGGLIGESNNIGKKSTVSGSLLYLSGEVSQTVMPAMPIRFNQSSLDNISFDGTSALIIPTSGFYYMEWKIILTDDQVDPKAFGVVINGDIVNRSNTKSSAMASTVSGSIVLNLDEGNRVELYNLSSGSKEIGSPSVSTIFTVIKIES
ncbi:hypothetical protein ACK8P5_16330 [Paenibacillus sp. EC2-1]|uniref:hypothetical protein n=1 Tax=Paenibacillus sp. EC2-1 TaxID=3388665 RepID=UPI003BEEE122